jgi:predicted membrane protein
MSILALIIAIVVVGFVLYLINRFVPMEAGVKNLLNIAVVIALIIWLLHGLGVFNYLREIRI